MPDLTPEEKQELLKDLKAAYYSGAKRIRFRERDVTYRTSEEMKEAITDLEAELTPRRRRRTSVVSFSTGL